MRRATHSRSECFLHLLCAWGSYQWFYFLNIITCFWETMMLWILIFITYMNNCRGVLNDTSAQTKTLVASPVLLFSNLNEIFFGYFDPENIYLDNKNNYFSGWAKRYISSNKNTGSVTPWGEVLYRILCTGIVNAVLVTFHVRWQVTRLFFFILKANVCGILWI